MCDPMMWDLFDMGVTVRPMGELYRSRRFVWIGDRAQIKGTINFPFLDSAYDRLCMNFGFNLEHLLPIPVYVDNSSNCQGGIGGWTSGGKLGFCAGEWADNHWCNGLLIHELVNLFTGEGITSGWPTSWWANGRSPFPTLISVRMLEQLGKIAQAKERDRIFSSDQWYCYFRKLHASKGWALWKALFQFMRERAIDLTMFEEPLKSMQVMTLISFFVETV